MTRNVDEKNQDEDEGGCMDQEVKNSMGDFTDREMKSHPEESERKRIEVVGRK